MVTRFEDREVNEKENMFGGAGKIFNRVIASQETMYNKNRLFQHGYLKHGDEVGYHVHNGDGEVYYILSGEGEFNDNGTVTTVKAGDTAWSARATSSSLSPS